MKFSNVAVLALVAFLCACALATPGTEQADERTLALQGNAVGVINEDDTTHDQRRNLLDNLVGNIICDATGSCHDNYGHSGYREDRDNRRDSGGGYGNNGYGYGNNGYGRKLMSLVGRTLKDDLVGDIICESTGSCHDNYGHYGYREDRDDRRYNGGGGYGDNGGGYGNNGGGYGNNGYGYGNNGYGRKLMSLVGRTLKDDLVGDIICDATGSCHDDYGHYGYREDRDNRRYNGGGGDGYDNNRGGYNNNGYNNNGYGR